MKMDKKKPPVSHEEDPETSSDFLDEPIGLTASEMQKMNQMGKALIKSAVSELRNEFQKFITEAVEITLSGDNIPDVQEQHDKRVEELQKLNKQLEKLQNEARKQKGGTAELQRHIKEKEKEIAVKEQQLKQLRKRLQKLQKQSDEKQQLHDEIVSKLQAENEDLKHKYNNVKGKLQVKESSENIARNILPDLRQQIKDLEAQLEIERKKKK
ncbi:myosin-6-like [Mytilus edulis]|uniref:myosin-6-like n=1 Tax=Mytilus edulis TaxID=6550 RepID=UPI0039EEA3ED